MTNATRVVTGIVRFGYAHVFKPHAIIEGQEPKYSVCLLIKKTDKATLKKIKDAIEAAKQAGKAMWGNTVPAKLKIPLRDGDEEHPDKPEYEGCYFMNANSNQKPGIVDKNLDEIMDASEFYSGCYGKASVNFFPFNTAGNKGIGCGLNNLMKTRDGEPLTSRSTPEDDFGVDDDMDDLLD